MAKASFTRKPAVSGIKLNGIITRPGFDEPTDADADEVLAKIVSALDGTTFDVESLSVTIR